MIIVLIISHVKIKTDRVVDFTYSFHKNTIHHPENFTSYNVVSFGQVNIQNRRIRKVARIEEIWLEINVIP